MNSLRRWLATLILAVAGPGALDAQIMIDLPTIIFGPVNVNPAQLARISVVNTRPVPLLANFAIVDAVSGRVLGELASVVQAGARVTLDYAEQNSAREIIGLGVLLDNTSGDAVEPGTDGATLQVLLGGVPLLVLAPQPLGVLDQGTSLSRTAYFGPLNLSIGQRAQLSLRNTSPETRDVTLALVETLTGKLLRTQSATLPPGGRLAADYIEQQALREVAAQAVWGTKQSDQIVSPRDAAVSLQTLRGSLPVQVLSPQFGEPVANYSAAIPPARFGPLNLAFGQRVRLMLLNPSVAAQSVALSLSDTATGKALAIRTAQVAPGGRLALDYIEQSPAREVAGFVAWDTKTPGQIVSPRDAAVSFQVLLGDIPVLVVPPQAGLSDHGAPPASLGPVNVNVGERLRMALLNTSTGPCNVLLELVAAESGNVLGMRGATIPSGGRVALDYIEQQNGREVLGRVRWSHLDAGRPATLNDAAVSLQLMLGNASRLILSPRSGDGN